MLKVLRVLNMRAFALITSGCAAMFAAQGAYALPVGSVAVTSGDVFISQTASGTFTCANVSGVWLPGKLVGSAKDHFLSFKAQKRGIKKELQTASGAQREKLLAKLSRVSNLARQGGPACEGGPGGGGGVPTPTATPSQGGNFDLSGNVTSSGKIAFAIPSALSANISTGRGHWNSMCAGCHGEKLNKSFTELRSKTQEAPMFFSTSSLPDSTLAHITAFLNRFRP